VLAAFEEVEDNLAALRILQDEATEQDAAVKAAEQALSLITIQYKAGTVSYLNVIVAQATALSNEITAVQILGRRMVAAALLVKALGGGWSADNLPSTSEFLEPEPPTGRDGDGEEPDLREGDSRAEGRRAAHGRGDVGDRVGALVLPLPIVEGVERCARVERRDDERPAVRPASQPVRNASGCEHDGPFVGAIPLGRHTHGGPLETPHLGQ